MLAGVMAKDECDWSWHSDRIDNRMETVLGGLGKLVERIAKDIMGSILDEMVAIVLYDWLPEMRIVAEAGFGFGPFFLWL
jgi:hypothetical protein